MKGNFHNSIRFLYVRFNLFLLASQNSFDRIIVNSKNYFGVISVHNEATYSLYALLERLMKLVRSQAFGDSETTSALAALTLLFQGKDLKDNVSVRMTDVSRHMLISKPAATQVVNRMVDRGFVERLSDESDRRVVYIRATEAGRAFYEEKMDRNLTLVDRVVDRMGEDETKTLAALLNRFFDSIDAETED